MSTDYQQARVAFGISLRELRLTCPSGRLTGTQLASALAWPHSKIYKCEGGKQTITEDDLRRWVDACGQPDKFDGMLARLRGFESQIRSWRRQLASGHSPVQDSWNVEVSQSTVIHAWEESVIPGMLQTADYARHVFMRYGSFFGSTQDADEAVLARAKRQAWLYESGHTLKVIMWEAALRVLVCPPSVLDAQLDRLASVVGMNSVELGIVPFAASLKLPPANGFWIFGERLVITEDWHAELWLDDAENIRLYGRVWATLHESAVYGTEAHSVISSARRALVSR
ncbi:helix-turn-helix domain-containing protein [Streptomyces rhizosphaerihabitans]|uniref:helix-turn-helix domain-containing protein n=1 Tax=Streptomyces rhizosphaerihabitans TaxID=1266770 RepID=UPI0021C17CAD|nr:helix-turn-helix domain-containing protein [Streptomyces rhizosphaerihabitans]MCT9009135.1 helix-turn-helix domain-containing protein [Streptomyces rhizosphaerihabitans]